MNYFFRTPKTGSSYMNNTLQRIMLENPHLEVKILDHSAHSSILKDIEFKEDDFIFTFTRNPYSRIVSAYLYLMTGGNPQSKDDLADSIRYVRPYKTFKEFVYSLSHESMKQIHIKPMFDWMCDNSGNVIPHFVGKVESLQSDFNLICDMLTIPHQHLNAHDSNYTNGKHYTEYYDDETRDIIAVKYAEDIEVFDYKFEEG